MNKKTLITENKEILLPEEKNILISNINIVAKNITIIFITLSIITNYFFFFFGDNYSKLKILLTNFPTYTDLYIYAGENLKLYISGLFIYLGFLAFIKEKKGLIFINKGDNFNANEKLNSKYIHIIGFIYTIFSFLLPGYIFYVFTNNYIYDGIAIFIVSFLGFLVINVLGGKFNQINNNYDALYKINGYDKNKKYKSSGALNFFFTIINNIISSTFLFAFLIVLVGYLFNFHILTILYLHIVFIFIFISLNIISNKFSPYVIISIKGKEKKGMLLEHSENRIILLQKNNRYIYKANDIEYIKIKNINK